MPNTIAISLLHKLIRQQLLKGIVAGADPSSPIPYLPSCAVVSVIGDLTFNLRGEPCLTFKQAWYYKLLFWIKPKTVTFVYASSKFSQNYKEYADCLENLRALKKAKESVSETAILPEAKKLPDNQGFLKLRRIYVNSKRVSLDLKWRELL